MVEILVALTVLGLVSLGLAQIFDLASQTWQTGLRQTNDFGKGRTVLDILDDDIRRGVFRPDLKNFPSLAPADLSANPNNPSYTFYTRLPGPVTGGSVRSVSQVTYQLALSAGGANSPAIGSLTRTLNSVPWGAANNTKLPFQQLLVSSTPVTTDAVTGGIVDFEMVFVRADGTYNNTYAYPAPGATYNPVIAIGVGIAVINDQTMKVLTQNGAQPQNLININAQLAGFVSGKNSIKADWDKGITPSFYSSYSKPLAAGLQTFERYVPCQPFN